MFLKVETENTAVVPWFNMPVMGGWSRGEKV